MRSFSDTPYHDGICSQAVVQDGKALTKRTKSSLYYARNVLAENSLDAYQELRMFMEKAVRILVAIKKILKEETVSYSEVQYK